MAEIMIQIKNTGAYCRVPGGEHQCHCLATSGSAPVCVAFQEPAVGSRKHKMRSARVKRDDAHRFIRLQACIDAENAALIEAEKAENHG
jgi:hypothetical protein